jgi:hypothetical protein
MRLSDFIKTAPECADASASHGAFGALVALEREGPDSLDAD